MPEKTLDLQVRGRMGPELAKLQEHLRQIGLLANKASGATTKQGLASSRAAHEVTRLSKAEAQAAQSNGRLMNALREGEVAMTRLAQRSGVAGGSMQAAAMVGTRGFDTTRRSVRSLGGEILNTTNYAQLLRGVLSAFFLYKGFVFLQQQSILFFRSLVELEHELGIIQTQLNHLGKDFRPRVRESILEIAGNTGVAMQDLAKAEFEIVSANIAVADSFEVLELTAKATVAGGIRDAELAFNAALSQANAFSLGVTQFDEVFDRQFQVIRRGIFTYEQYATVVGTVSEAFASMGQDVETPNAALAAISQVFTGKQIERGATGLRNAVLRLGEAPEKFEELGVSVTNAQGDFRNFVDIGRDLNAVLEGMNQQTRARVIKDLFPDERERRGINAFLGQLDEAEQFMIEQRFSAGSLDDAVESVNDSLLQQSRILQQDLIPAMEPFVRLADLLVGAFNELEDLFPGINASLMTTAIIAGSIGGGMLISGGRFPLTRAPAGPITRTTHALTRGRLPTALGATAGAAVPLTSFMAGRSPGDLSSGDYLGTALSGAGIGAFLGGPAGAAVGATLSVAALALGDALEAEAPSVAKSFVEALKENLRMESADISQSIANALLGVGSEFSASAVQAAAAGSGLGTRRETQEEHIQRIGGDSGVDRFGAELGVKTADAWVRLGNALGVPLDASDTGGTVGFRRGDVSTSASELRDRLAEVEETSAELGLTSQQAADSVATVRDGFLDMVAPLEGLKGQMLEEQVARRALIVGLAGSNLGLTEMSDLLDQLAGGDVSLKEFFRRVRDASLGAEHSFGALAATIETMFVGELKGAAEVFSHLGAEGETLADVFGRLSRVSEALALVESLRGTMVQVGETTTFTGKETLGLSRFGLPDIRPGKDLSAAQVAALQGIGSMTHSTFLEELVASGRVGRTTEPDRRSAFELAFGSGDFDVQIAEALLQTATQQGVDLLNITPDQQATLRDTFLNGLMTFVEEGSPFAGLGDAIAEPLRFSSTSLADRLLEAADAVDHGLIDPMGFTGDSLHAMADTLQRFNRLVFQRGIVEEVGRVAEFAFGQGSIPADVMSAMAEFEQGARQAAREFFGTFQDPKRFAELLAELEFNVDVDNSTQNNFTFRVSGDVSESQLRALEDAVARGMTRAQREANAR